jgi:hypothetical protein
MGLLRADRSLIGCGGTRLYTDSCWPVHYSFPFTILREVDCYGRWRKVERDQ